jgi:hypothetical protein
MEIELIASIVPVISGLLLVVYTQGPFGARDLAIGALILYILWQYRQDFAKDSRVLVVSQFGIAVALMIVLMSLLTLLCFPVAEAIRKAHWRIFSVPFLITGLLFVLSRKFYPGRIDESAKQPVGGGSGCSAEDGMDSGAPQT